MPTRWDLVSGRVRRNPRRSIGRALVVVVAIAASLVIAPVTAGAASSSPVPQAIGDHAGTRTAYPVVCDEEPPPGYRDSVCWPGPRGIAVAPDGDVWVTYSYYGPAPNAPPSIVRFDPDTGTMDRFQVGEWDEPSTIIAGPDGAMWFANEWSLGRIDEGGNVTTSTILDDEGQIIGVRELTFTSDGAVWVVGRHWVGSELVLGLARFDPATGESLVIDDPAVGEPNDITTGPDGELWFTTSAPDTHRTIGRVTATGVVTTFETPVPSSGSITIGPDGHLWFSTATGVGSSAEGAIGRITSAGTVSTVTAGLPAWAWDLTAGPNGTLWFRTLITLDNGTQRWVLGSRSAAGEIAIDPSVGSSVEHFTIGSDDELWLAEDSTGDRSIDRIELHGAPGPPTEATVRPARTWATVQWEPPVFGGNDPVTSYEVVVQPGGQTCTRTAAQARSCELLSLTPGVEHTFTVTATSASGEGTPVVAEQLPALGSTYHPVTATRLLDSRTANGGWNAKLVAGADRELQVAGRAGVPATATAVVVNVTVTDVASASYVSVFPAGSPVPISSSVNVAPGDTRPNLVTARLGDGGRLSFTNAIGSVNVVADVVGYYDDAPDPGLFFNAVSPTRVLDTRDPASATAGAPITAGSPISLPAIDRAGIDPADAEAVVVNITATGATKDTFVRVWDADDQIPTTSSVNVRAGETIANLAVVGTGGDLGSIGIASAVGSVEVVVDVVGWFSGASGDRFHPLEPERVLDTRVDPHGLDHSLGPGEPRFVEVGGWAGATVPRETTGVVANVTGTDPTTETFLRVYVADLAAPIPTTSTLNLGAGQTVANSAYVGVQDGVQYQSQRNALVVYNHLGSVEVVIDVAGWFGPS